MSAAPRLFPDPDRVIRAAPEFRIGTFRCPVEHPAFRTAGPIEGYTLVFPRSSVWIQHDGRPAFVADPGVVAIYNRSQPYTRRPLAPEGDRSDWISLSRELATSIVSAIDPEAAASPAGPFPVAFGRSSAELYYQQRLLFSRLLSGTIDDFELEQEIVLLAGATLERALSAERTSRMALSAAPRELVEAARAEIARDPLARLTVHGLASRLQVSPFHLCRTFRRVTGLTLHHYQLELRTRLALEQIDGSTGNLSRLAQELGFSSHSHFTEAFRTRMGRTPSRARTQLHSLRKIGDSSLR
ncbi:MAG: AraC family transcriptional regulator [Gemmatimonadales bacterium]